LSYEDDTFDEADFYASSSPAPLEVEVPDEAPVAAEVGVDDNGAVEDGGSDATLPTPTYFDPSTYTDHLVKVKVDGEEVEVPVAEMVQGYQRQADYTRKTQEVAQQREQLAFWQDVDKAMRVDPRATLEYLQKQYGLGEAAPAAEDDWGYSAPDPVKQELQELRAVAQEAASYVSERKAEEHLQRVVGGLTARYGNEFDVQAVIQEAVNRGIQDPARLEPLFKEMAFEKYRAQAAAQQAVGDSTSAAELQRRAAAANAAVLIGSGGSSSGAVKPPPAQPRTVHEAYALAKAELGG